MGSTSHIDEMLKRPAFMRRAFAPWHRTGWLRCLYVAAAAFVVGYSRFQGGHHFPSHLPDYVDWGLLPAVAALLSVTVIAFFVRWWHGLIYLALSIFLLPMLVSY